ncbi:MAG TPA: hypothetical protein VIE65_06680 [Methylobacter sp.]
MTDEKHPPNIGKYGSSLLAIVLTICLAAGILFPPIIYAFGHWPRSASDVVVNISVCLFSSVVYLWTLHAISIITFRDTWMGKAIFGAAITGILGTSAMIYRSQLLSSDSYPLSGKWNLELKRIVDDNNPCVWNGDILVVNDISAGYYIGLAADGTELSDGCRYGIKDITGIEWDDANDIIELAIKNFPNSNAHSNLNAAPSPIILKLTRSGKTWVSAPADKVSPDIKTHNAAFTIVLKRRY